MGMRPMTIALSARRGSRGLRPHGICAEWAAGAMDLEGMVSGYTGKTRTNSMNGKTKVVVSRVKKCIGGRVGSTAV